MAVTFTPVVSSSGVTTHDIADLQALIGYLSFSGNYSAGGDALSFAALLIQNGVGIADYVGVNPMAGYILQYNYSSLTLQVFDTGASSGAALAELAAGAYPGALTAVQPRLIVIGR